MLHCDFPLGRPLGKPNDIEFQTDVIRRALALLDRTDAPILEDHPVTIDDEAEAPASCSLPPRHDPDVHAAIDEVRGLRNAYGRSVEQFGRTAVGRLLGDHDADPATVPEGIVELVEKIIEIENGASLDDVDLAEGRLIAAGQDIRAYYEEAGLQLAPNTGAGTGARQLESWFYSGTETGRLMRRAQQVMKADETSDTFQWQYMLPRTQAG